MADSKDKESAASQFFSGLFWKTFGMLFILVLTSVGAWLYGLSVLDEEPPGAERVSAHYFYYDANPLCADQRGYELSIRPHHGSRAARGPQHSSQRTERSG